jgi:integration host factor subunit beta
MNKSDLIETLHQTSGFDLQMAEFVVTEVFQAMTETMVQGKRIELRGLGSFEVRKYKGYTGRNPKTGKQIRIKPKKLPFFKVGKALRERVMKHCED